MGVFCFMCKYSQIAHLLVSFVKPRAKHPFSQWMQHHEKSWSGVKKERDGWGGGGAHSNLLIDVTIGGLMLCRWE